MDKPIITHFTNKQVAEIAGMKGKTITYYSNRGLINPSVSPGAGRGGNRLYSAGDILKFILVPVLSDHGLNLEKIEKVFECVKRDLFGPSNPHLYHGLPYSRAILTIFNVAGDITANVMFPPDPAGIEHPERKEQFEKNLNVPADMLRNESILIIDITDCINRLA